MFQKVILSMEAHTAASYFMRDKRVHFRLHRSFLGKNAPHPANYEERGALPAYVLIAIAFQMLIALLPLLRLQSQRKSLQLL